MSYDWRSHRSQTFPSSVSIFCSFEIHFSFFKINCFVELLNWRIEFKISTRNSSFTHFQDSSHFFSIAKNQFISWVSHFNCFVSIVFLSIFLFHFWILLADDCHHRHTYERCVLTSKYENEILTKSTLRHVLFERLKHRCCLFEKRTKREQPDRALITRSKLLKKSLLIL